VEKSIVFDFDGTLLNSMPPLTKQATKLISDHYLVSGEFAYREYTQTVGLSFEEQLFSIFGEQEAEKHGEVADIFYEIQKNIYAAAGLHEGVREELSLLKYLSVPFAIVSSTHGDLVRQAIRRWELPTPSHVMGRDAGPKGWQLTALKGAGYRVFIGDTPIDGQIAEDARIPFIGVEHTFPRSVFREADLVSEMDLHDAVAVALKGTESTSLRTSQSS